jgi:cytochrome c oxidase cbb3-type subunit 3
MKMSRSIWIGSALGVLLIAVGATFWLQRAAAQRTAQRLLAGDADVVAQDPDLRAFALRTARPLYAKHCAGCHGTQLTGNPALGAPNLTDHVWLFGNGSVFSIERTLLYGIRSGAGQTRNVTDMPAFGVRGMLTATDINNVVQYLLRLNLRPYQTDAADEGRLVYGRKANCGDCHGGDARGNPDYGAPDLTVNVWNNGDDAASLYRAIYFGQHHIMPGWIDTLSLVQIRALAVYVYDASHPTMR